MLQLGQGLLIGFYKRSAPASKGSPTNSFPFAGSFRTGIPDRSCANRSAYYWEQSPVHSPPIYKALFLHPSACVLVRHIQRTECFGRYVPTPPEEMQACVPQIAVGGSIRLPASQIPPSAYPGVS